MKNYKNNNYLTSLNMDSANESEKLEWLNRIIENELKKPESKIDMALISECTSAIRELEKANEDIAFKESYSASCLERIKNAAEKRKSINTKTKPKMKLALLLCIVISAILLSVLAVGGAYLIMNYNADFLGISERQKTVPDNYIGIYSLEDLLETENAPSDTNFILMKNIDIPDSAYEKGGIFEGGFKPLICNDENSYSKNVPCGIFDGNGYVIRNLKIYADLSDSFGEGIYDEYCFGLFAKHNGNIRNLGIESCEIIIDAPGPSTSVGAICGRAQSIAGCYATDVSIKVTQSNSKYETERPVTTNIGGIAGFVQYIDCCYTDAEINVVGNKPADGKDGPDVNTAGVAGKVFATVTSYSTGSVSTEGYFSSLSKDACVISNTTASLPTLIPDIAMEKIIAKFDEKSPSNGTGAQAHSFKCNKFLTFYILKTDNTDKYPEYTITGDEEQELKMQLNAIISSSSYLFIGDINKVEGWYVCDFERSVAEDNEIADIIIDLFGDYDTFAQFCMENNIKCGNLYSRALDAETTYTEADLPEFDFERIWKIKDGKPTLKIFE